MIRIHPIQTGCVQVKTAQQRRKIGGLLRVFTDREWTEWLPIYCWAIEHPEGVIVVDTGETARTSEPNYFPYWHPYYRLAIRVVLSSEQEIGPQLHKIGIDSQQVPTVILTHFHHDHAGGLHHFPNSNILVCWNDYRIAQGFFGKLRGYLPYRWPEWFAPIPIEFKTVSFGSFGRSYALTEAGDVVVVPTPGHTPGHISVVVKTEGLSYFLAGDTSYTEELLIKREPDAVSPSRKTAIQTIDTILQYAQEEPTVYLPSHDPKSVERLKNKQTIKCAP